MSRAAVSPAALVTSAREESESHVVQTATLAGDGGEITRKMKCQGGGSGVRI